MSKHGMTQYQRREERRERIQTALWALALSIVSAALMVAVIWLVS